MSILRLKYYERKKDKMASKQIFFRILLIDIKVVTQY